MSTFGGLEISKRSLFAHQAALTTTAHNMANQATRGYSRQTVNFVASKPLEAVGMMRSAIPGQIGTGVEFDSVTRIREKFLDDQFYNEHDGLGEWSIKQDTLEKLESIFNEPSDTGIRQVIDNFWNSWQELSKQPDNLETRAVVKESALALADAFNHTARQLSDLQADLTDNINATSSQINSLLSQAAQLNQEIYRIEGLGNNANDLRDQRDVIMDDLSNLINIEVSEQPNGYLVTMGGVELVNGNAAVEFTTQMANQSFASGNLNSGKIAGMIHSRDEYVTQYQAQLNGLVATMATAVNDVHQQGYTLKHPVQQGGLFFEFDSNGTAAATIRVHADITSDVENIAASKRLHTDEDGVEWVVRGNNDLALELAGLKNFDFNFTETGLDGVNLNGGTFDEYLRAVLGELGIQTQEAQRKVFNQVVLVEQIEMRRQSVSGVSLDEEMANMIRFQHGYNAAARAMTTFDQMLDHLINQTGIVGR